MYIQVGVLAIVAMIGISFTFALPKPRHQLKAKSASYARWFLVASWLVVFCQAISHIGYIQIGLPGVYASAIAGAYMLLMSVLKRYGTEVSQLKKFAAVIHIVGIFVTTSVLVATNAPSWIAHSLALSSVAFPVWQALHCVKQHFSSESIGGHLLFGVLALVIAMVLFGVPAYLTIAPADSYYHLAATSAFMLVIMLIFMLAFAVNILQSLLLKLRSQVHTDPLTGAKNRHFFYEIAPKLSAHAKRKHETLSLVACDIDYFKAINDEHGHVIGDIALKRFCEIIQSQLRQEDTLIRMGGEEFLILSPQYDGDKARQMAERLRETISESIIAARGIKISLTASFGVIQMPPDADLFATVKSADQALYDAKANGRNKVIMV
ncbi:GGDEF domain-containing protein [uncultured Alteromonas sp.]|uniref:GGDEF domain-containing protein n=1 Tax=uncultured Alteromonas sp. TaxID=179113 RepID=UPI0025F76D32|nr:GGDEF domain-containing protein [uncultured Alteromonas sp.]